MFGSPRRVNSQRQTALISITGLEIEGDDDVEAEDDDDDDDDDRDEL